KNARLRRKSESKLDRPAAHLDDGHLDRVIDDDRFADLARKIKHRSAPNALRTSALAPIRPPLLDLYSVYLTLTTRPDMGVARQSAPLAAAWRDFETNKRSLDWTSAASRSSTG